MKQCATCQTIYKDEFAFCPNCGSPVNRFIEENAELSVTKQPSIQSQTEVASQIANEFKFCANCGNKISKQCNFCEFCGAKAGQPATQMADVMKKIKGSEFVKSISKDFENSATVDIIKQKTNDISRGIRKSDKLTGLRQKKTLRIAIVAGIAVVVLLSSIHICDDCGDLYFGKKNKEVFYDEVDYVCDDCYGLWR